MLLLWEIAGVVYCKFKRVFHLLTQSHYVNDIFCFFPFDILEKCESAPSPLFQIRTEATNSSILTLEKIHKREALSQSNFGSHVEELSFKRFISRYIHCIIVRTVYQRQVHLTLKFYIPPTGNKCQQHVKINFILCASEFILHPDKWESEISTNKPFVDLDGIYPI